MMIDLLGQRIEGSSALSRSRRTAGARRGPRLDAGRAAADRLGAADEGQSRARGPGRRRRVAGKFDQAARLCFGEHGTRSVCFDELGDGFNAGDRERLWISRIIPIVWMPVSSLS